MGAEASGARRRGCLGPGLLVGGGFLLAVVGLATALALFVYAGSEAFRDVTNLAGSVPAGSSEVLDLDDGEYVVYLEGPSLFEAAGDGTTERRSDLVEPEVTILDPDGVAVGTDEIGADIDIGGFDGTDRIAHLTFDAPTTGAYTVDVSDPGGPVTSVGVGPALDVGAALGTLAVALVVGLAAGVVGTSLVIGGAVWAIVRASRRPTPPPPPWGPPGAGAPPNQSPPPGYQPGY